MKAFGIRFAISDHERFARLAALFDRLKKDKTAGMTGDPKTWKALVPR